MSDVPPPLPKAPPPLPSKQTFFHYAATACLLAPFVAFAANVMWIVILDSLHSSSPIPPRQSSISPAILGGITFLGLLLGVVSLLGIRRHGSDHILPKAKRGMTLCGILLLACIPGLQRQANEPVRQKDGAGLSHQAEVAFGGSGQFRSLVLSINEYKRLPDGSQSMIVMATNKNDRLSLEVVLDAGWQSKDLGKGIPQLKGLQLMMHRGTVAYRSIGPESDAFVQALDEIYGTKTNPKAMIKERRFPAVSLEGDPSDLSKGVAKMKLFYEPDKEEDYAEFFTNIDLRNNTFTLAEKDVEFRVQIVKALQSR